ncbi:MAG: signal recognition particle receptor subunit alpha [Nanoarchaeota archaeon]|nr:signal recognition particle receptor subunit alpha [Nanoarchaeota archaeon]MBU4086654.1 signal recognition particle receptor subunit alpha [Nanoarchaeota archaeon]
MFGKLGEAIKKGIDKIASAVFVDKELIDSIVKDLQRALIEADVNVVLVKEISEKIRKAAIDERIKGIEKKEHIIKILHDELKSILGGEKHELELKKGKLQKIMLLGLFGVGKTTLAARLAAYYSKRGFKTCMLGLDVHRPAASDQLEQLGQRNNLKSFVNKKEKNPIKIYEEFESRLKDYDIALIDTAGRDALDSELIKEIKNIGRKIKPDYIILVMPADIGQAAKRQASEFQKALSVNGVIITRMDSTAKGGGALTACSETNAPVFFITTGEQINDIETFSPEQFISRMLGMGDLQGLLERVTSVVDEKKQKNIQDRLKQGKFTMLDLYEQLKSMEGLGSLSKLKSLIPGLGNAKISDDMLGTQEEKLKKFKFAIQSMTHEEIENPEIIEKQTHRIGRIAKGAGINASDVRALLKQYKLIKEFAKSGIANEDMSKGFSEKQMMKLAKKFGKKIRM